MTYEKYSRKDIVFHPPIPGTRYGTMREMTHKSTHYIYYKNNPVGPVEFTFRNKDFAKDVENIIDVYCSDKKTNEEKEKSKNKKDTLTTIILVLSSFFAAGFGGWVCGVVSNKSDSGLSVVLLIVLGLVIGFIMGFFARRK